jgi:hypothetical protein
MILHCWYCSLGGERTGDHSAVARVNPNLHQPVDTSMFSPLNGTSPFMAGADWLHMKHQACGKYPWPQLHVIPHYGPEKILTDAGLVPVPTKQAPEANVCQKCNKAFKSRAGMMSHMRIKHADEETIDG